MQSVEGGRAVPEDAEIEREELKEPANSVEVFKWRAFQSSSASENAAFLAVEPASDLPRAFKASMDGSPAATGDLDALLDGGFRLG